jgi:nucleoside-diphosphate-sugar epimerase
VKVLVTGAAGFLGRACVKTLAAAGHDVVTTDRRGSVTIAGDLADENFAARLPDAEAVVHAAGVQYLSPDLPLVGRRPYFERNNVVAATRLSGRYAGTGAHIVNVGTSMMYEQSGRALYDVTSPMRGQGDYTASKVAAHEVIRAMPNPTACVVPCIIAGTGRAGLFRQLTASMVRWRTVVYPGRGTHPVHLTHVEDVAALIRAVVGARATGILNAASPAPLSIADWVVEIASELKLPSIRTIRLPLQPIEAVSAALGYRILAREQLLMLRFPHVLAVETSLALGWTPRYTNAQIVRETARGLAAVLD